MLLVHDTNILTLVRAPDIIGWIKRTWYLLAIVGVVDDDARRLLGPEAVNASVLDSAGAAAGLSTGEGRGSVFL